MKALQATQDYTLLVGESLSKSSHDSPAVKKKKKKIIIINK